jgi:hypothetical protein
MPRKKPPLHDQIPERSQQEGTDPPQSIICTVHAQDLKPAAAKPRVELLAFLV